MVWGSALYEVLAYFNGSYKDAKKHSLHITEETEINVHN